MQSPFFPGRGDQPIAEDPGEHWAIKQDSWPGAEELKTMPRRTKPAPSYLANILPSDLRMGQVYNLVLRELPVAVSRPRGGRQQCSMNLT